MDDAVYMMCMEFAKEHTENNLRMAGIPCFVSPCMMPDGTKGICLDVADSGHAIRVCVPTKDGGVQDVCRELERAEELIKRDYAKKAVFQFEFAFPTETLTKCCFVEVEVPKTVTRYDVIYAFKKAHEYLDEWLEKDRGGPYAKDGRKPDVLARHVAKEKGWDVCVKRTWKIMGNLSFIK